MALTTPAGLCICHFCVAPEHSSPPHRRRPHCHQQSPPAPHHLAATDLPSTSTGAPPVDSSCNWDHTPWALSCPAALAEHPVRALGQRFLPLYGRTIPVVPSCGWVCALIPPRAAVHIQMTLDLHACSWFSGDCAHEEGRAGGDIQLLEVKEGSQGPRVSPLDCNAGAPVHTQGPRLCVGVPGRAVASAGGGGPAEFSAASCPHRRTGVRVPHGTAGHPRTRGASPPTRAPQQPVQHPVSRGPLPCTLWPAPPPATAQGLGSRSY